MFKGKISKKQKEVLLELLKLMAESDGSVTQEEMEMILKIKKTYHMKNYEYKNMTLDEIRISMSEMKENDVLNILTHAVLLALVDGECTIKEKALVSSHFDLLSLESASQMQKLLDEYGNGDFDVRDFFIANRTEQDILDDSLGMLDDFSNGKVEDIDESLLMKMKRGPIKKIWNQVILLWEAVRDPSTDAKLKALGIGALLYLICPIDAIPDAIPALGLTDDVGIVVFAINQLTSKRKKTN